MSKVNFSDPVVERAIFYHRFAALVEVTNGIIDPIRRQEKKKQIKKGKRLIESRFGDEVEVVGGLALIRNTEKEIKELDFQISIPQYNLRVLYGVLDEILLGPHLTPQQKEKVEEMSDTSRGLAYHLTAPLNQRKRVPGIRTTKDEEDALGKVKGVVLEYYAKALLEEVIDPTFGLVISLRTDIKRSGDPRYNHSTPDLLLACPQLAFYEGLERLADKYSGKQKIQIKVKEK